MVGFVHDLPLHRALGDEFSIDIGTARDREGALVSHEPQSHALVVEETGSKETYMLYL